MKKKVKRYAGQDKSLVEIEERSIKTPRLIEEEKAKAPMDYAGLGGRARATSMMSGPVLDIKEEKTETESEVPKSEASKGIAAGFDAKRYLEESESKGGGPRSETKPAVEKKKKVAPKRASQSFGETDMTALEERRKTSASTAKEPPLAKVGKAIKGTAEAAGRRYSESNPFAKRMAGGGKVSSASSRADGIAQRGKTKGRIC
jgi:hypothetical protein